MTGSSRFLLRVTVLLASNIAPWASPARAADPPPADPPPAAASHAAPADEGAAEAPIEVVVQGRQTDRPAGGGRAGSKVDRRELEETVPRSAPDALRYEPGVYVQQTAHGQGSPFVRGRTGQQVLLLFDGIRLNNSTFRQGPNQYFFTVDARTIHSIEVTRGGASTLYGSDALAGVIDAKPLEPALDITADGIVVRPRVMVHGATQDSEMGFRQQLDLQLTRELRVLGGVGSRRAGRLESGGPVCGPDAETCTIDSEERALVPRFEEDGRTQLGTGFREITADGRAVYAPWPGSRVVAAAYVYRQLDAPRTDQCPPPYAARVECLTYDEQFRTLGYIAYRASSGPAWAENADVTASFQRQHERRTRRRPQSFIENGGRDDVTTLGTAARLRTAAASVTSWMRASLGYGGDFYVDFLDSAAWTLFTDNDILVPSSRGQYLAGSTYTQAGTYADLEATFAERVVLRTGGRAGFSRARAPEDEESGTLPVDRAWPVVVGHAGVEVRALRGLSLLANVDRSYRTPNLDDLTSRQQTGPGFQLENAALGPEQATTLEAGVRADLPFLEADAWAYRSILDDAIVRASRDIAACPRSTSQCAASWSRYQLVNLGGPATIDGFELSARAWFPAGLSAKATLAYAFGEGPNPQDRPADPSVAYEETVPLSRIPPLNGTAELRWDSRVGAYVGAALRWALAQDRLAISDRSDARIPLGGTPGFAVFDLRSGWRFRRNVLVSLVLENVGDAAYRYHGSSVNGPGRGLIVNFEAGL